MRTTLDLDAPILRELKTVQKEEGVSLGKLVSRLLADALASRGKRPREQNDLGWTSRSMGAMVDLSDKEALYRILDRP